MPKQTTVYLHVWWHQHQPWYISPNSNVGLMPWVRLHATKDYYDIAVLGQMYEGWKQTINLVPSLLEQLQGYCDERFTDRALILSRKPAAELTREERQEIVERFFDAHAPRLVHPFPRYDELLRKRGHHPAESVDSFTNQDILDLQVWFNLAWIDPIWRDNPNYPLKEIIEKHHHFTEEDKQIVLDTQFEILRQVIPIHREMREAGALELTTTPYFHPILPLLCDSDIAKISNPHDPTPDPPFLHPEDADWHIENGLAYFESLLGFRPRGMWPSEGSVSDEACMRMRKAGVDFFATDEEVLFRSQAANHHSWTREDLYRLHRLETPEGPIDCVFRDHGLSDLIGFEFQDRDPKRAAAEFIGHLKNIGKNWTGDHPPLVSVILDGENCWEFYPRDGHDFLKYWIEGILHDSQITPTTLPEYRKLHPPQPTMQSIFPGSWISHNFRIWIGHPEDNTAWSFLRDARKTLTEAEANLTEEQKEQAWRQLYICEGSDWYWWYGDENSSSLDALFDELFRTHLIRLYECIGQPAPQGLRHSINSTQQRVKRGGGVLFGEPPIGEERPAGYYSWIGARRLPPGGGGGAMHSATALRLDILYGRNEDSLAFRIRTEDGEAIDPQMIAKVVISQPRAETVDLSKPNPKDRIAWRENGIEGLLRLDARNIDNSQELWFHFEFRSADGSVFSLPHGSDLYLNARSVKNSDLIWYL